LKSKEGGAMVQMNHCDNLRQHLKSLNSTFIFGQTFIIVYVEESLNKFEIDFIFQ